MGRHPRVSYRHTKVIYRHTKQAPSHSTSCYTSPLCSIPTTTPYTKAPSTCSRISHPNPKNNKKNQNTKNAPSRPNPLLKALYTILNPPNPLLTPPTFFLRGG